MAMAHGSRRGSSLVKIGGALGIAASFIGLAAFMSALPGFYAAFMLSPLPVILGVIGLVMTVVGGVVTTHLGEEETQPIAALFVCITGLIFGMIGMHLWWNLK